MKCDYTDACSPIDTKASNLSNVSCMEGEIEATETHTRTAYLNLNASNLPGVTGKPVT